MSKLARKYAKSMRTYARKNGASVSLNNLATGQRSGVIYSCGTCLTSDIGTGIKLHKYLTAAMTNLPREKRNLQFVQAIRNLRGTI